MPTLVEQKVAPDIVAPMRLPAEFTDSDAQRAWAKRPISERLRVIKRARHLIAQRTDALCTAISPALARNAADTMCAEILPLLSAFEFLEREAETVLRPRILGKHGRPLWLMGVWSEVHRVPLGRILVIAPSNYPLFLPGVQIAQALVAGNAAIWKPGPDGREVATLFANTMQAAGLPEGLLDVTDDSVEAARRTIDAGVDKIFFTGSAKTGKVLLKQLAETLTPCVAELSGCDAVFVLPSADLSRVVKAVTFGMRLNGSATCMAPRRIIFIGADAERRASFVASLLFELESVEGVTLPSLVQQDLQSLIADAIAAGASVHGDLNPLQKPLLATRVTSSMRIGQADIFAPLLVLIEARSADEALTVNDACPYALTAAIFGDDRESLKLAQSVTAGTVIVNDVMVPAADPRTPFGGRKSSGFGVTQGSEGLLEMTAPKTIAVRRGKDTSHYEATSSRHERFFKGIIDASHSGGWRQRLAGLMQVLSSANDLKRKN